MNKSLLLSVVSLSSLALAAASHWAVLVAGSSGYGNYRHQSDVCHAYQVLHSRGVPDDHIITFLYDDIANDPSNPFPGQVFNAPAFGTGVDVYEGCKMSYTGANVTASNFLAVLTGNTTGVSGGSGEVLHSTQQDEVFIFYADHGAGGLVAMPTGPFLYADDLYAALSFMYTNQMYRKLTFYLEACESGSMFDGILAANISVYATTASNPQESSWGTYCPPQDNVNGTHLGTCLGDLYSVNWLQNADSDGKNVASETLGDQFNVVFNETTLSHVMQYGDTTFLNWSIGTFEGDEPAPTNKEYVAPEPPKVEFGWSSRLATFNSLQARLRSTPAGPLQRRLRAELATELIRNRRMDHGFHTVAHEHFRGGNAEELLAQTVTITQWSCYKQVNAQVTSGACGGYSDYSLRYAKIAAMMCEQYNGDANFVGSAINKACITASENSIYSAQLE